MIERVKAMDLFKKTKISGNVLRWGRTLRGGRSGARTSRTAARK
jgi:hypothetical protein